jgi:RecA-family ATPase
MDGGIVDPTFLDEATGAKAKTNGTGGTKKGKSYPPFEYVWYSDTKPFLDTGNTLVKGWFFEEQLSVVYGPPSCGKTFLVLSLAQAIATGKEWGGSKVKRGGVVYIAAEAGRTIAQRMYAFKMHHKVAGVVPFASITDSIALVDPRKNPTDDAYRLLNTVDEIAARMTVMDAAPSMIIIDTLNRALAGGDENSSVDMGKFTNALTLLRDKLKCHVLVVHHTGKDLARGERGHSSLRGNVDTAVEVVKDKATGVSTATIVKQRDGKEGPSKSFKLPVVTIGYDDEDQPVTSCVVEWTDAPPPKDTGRPSKNPRLAFDTLKETLERDGRDGEHGRVIKLDAWEAACRKAHGFGVKAESFRNTWKRASEPLMTRDGPVGFDPKGLMVWIKAQGQLRLDEEPF